MLSSCLRSCILTESRSASVFVVRFLNGAILEQPHIVEFVVHDRLCPSCSCLQANPYQWIAAVQVHQHVSHRRTFLYLEQLILRHGAATRAVRIAAAPHGLDFYFSSHSHASRLVDFLKSVIPVQFRPDKQLVSHDIKSSVYNYKYIFSAEISPICQEDLICLPPKVAHSLGNLGPLVLCTKVSNSIILMDPFNLRVAYLNATQYWSDPFHALLSSRQLIEYSILAIYECVSDIVTIAGSRYQLAYVQVARMSDFSKIFTVKTHLGHLLNVGDNAFGYDLFGANTNDMEMDKYKGLVLPDCVLVKKSYEERRARRRGKQHNFKLKRLDIEDAASGRKGEEDRRNDEYRKFLEDIEENPELRFNISLYKNEDYAPSEMGSSMADGEEIPSVPIEELVADLEDLVICDDQE